MFKIVETVECGEKHFCVVPRCWEKNSQLFWPKHLKGGDVRKLLKNMANPEKNWAIMACTVKATADSHCEAKQLEKLYAAFTDTESEERLKQRQSLAPKKRMQKAKPQKAEEDYNYAMENIQYINKIEQIPCNIDATYISYPGTSLLNDSYQPNENDNIKEVNLLLDEPMISNTEDVNSYVIPPPNQIISEIEEIQTNINNMKEDQRVLISTITEELNGIHIKLDRLLKHIDEPKRDKNNCVELVLTKDVVFPIENVDEIIDLNNLLGESNFRTEMINRLSAIGGTDKAADGSKIMYRIIDFMFAPQVLNKFSWTGSSKSQERKECFQKLINIVDLLYDVIYLADCRHSHQRNEDFLKNKILKHSKQRLQRKRKNENAANSGILFQIDPLQEECI